MPTSPRGLARGQQFSSAAMSKPSGGIRSLPSLSAWGLPTPIVALPVFVTLIFGCFLVQVVNFYFYGVCKFAVISLP